jgi:hypothetical protein
MSRVAQWIDDLWHDTRLGVRALRRNPGFTASAVFVLAVGIGLNLAFLHVVKATLSANLPFRDADTLVRIVRQSPEAERWAMTMDALRFYRENTTVFSYILAERLTTEPVQVQQDDEDARAKFVSGNYFVDLGVTPALGRVLEPADDQRGAPLVAVLTDGYWKRRFGGDPSVVSQTVTIVVRTRSDARTVMRRARSAASMPNAKPSAWLLQRPIDQLLQHSLAASRMIGALGAVAAGLAAFGIFGLLAFAVRKRTRELAVRRALGTHARTIASLLLRQYLTLLAAGVGAGAVLATLVAKAMIGVNAGLGLDTSLDAVGYLLGLATFGLALLAAVLPAVRGATRVDPVVALRAE